MIGLSGTAGDRNIEETLTREPEKSGLINPAAVKIIDKFLIISRPQW